MSPDQWQRDSIVVAALDALTDDELVRHLSDLNDLYLRMIESPDAYGAVDFELKREALVRKANGDPTWPAWVAWLRSRDQAVEVEALWEAQE